MANIDSAKKAHRQSIRRRVFNVRRVRTMKDLLKDLEKAVSPAEAAKILPTVYQAIDKAVKRGVIKKNTGDRRKAGAAKRVASLSKAK